MDLGLDKPNVKPVERCGAVRPIDEAGTHRSKRMKNAVSAVGILVIHGPEDVKTSRKRLAATADGSPGRRSTNFNSDRSFTFQFSPDGKSLGLVGTLSQTWSGCTTPTSRINNHAVELPVGFKKEKSWTEIHPGIAHECPEASMKTNVEALPISKKRWYLLRRFRR
jgi:hypothetical protein